MMSNFEIVFHGYCEGEMWHPKGLEFGGLGKIEKFWDEYENGELYKEAGVTDEQIIRVWNDRRLNSSSRSVIPEEYRSTVLRDEDRPAGGFDYYTLSFDKENLDNYRHAFSSYLGHLPEDEKRTGADDGTYDYYPAAWEVAYQIAWALELEEAYRGAYGELMKTRYGDEDGDLKELIAEWGSPV